MAYSSLIGARVKRKEDPRLITGQGSFVGDLRLPGLQHVAFVRSPHPHARILGIDASEALQLPGVHAVITGAELKSVCEPLPVDYHGTCDAGVDAASARPKLYALAVDRVRYVGEAVAAIIAETAAIAEHAAAAVLVDWDPLPVVVDPEEACHDDAPRLFPGTSNVAGTVQKHAGDVAGAFANAFRVVRQRMVNQRLAGIPLEGRAVVAQPDSSTGGLTVWSSTQLPHSVRTELAKGLRLPQNAIRVIAPDVGGGFGVKGSFYPEELVLAALARMYQFPVAWVETRTEGMAATVHGRAQVAEVEAAVEPDGHVVALRMRITADLGAYPLGTGIAELTVRMATGCYQIATVDIQSRTVCTNTTPVVAFRGAGRPEAAYYIERLMDLIAADLVLDPVAVRHRNFIPPEAFPYKTPTGETYDSGNYDRALAHALDLAAYPALRAEQARRRAAGSRHLLGIGVASYVEMCGFGPYESAIVRVEPGGSVTVFTGISPHGQGQETTFAQIVADQLGADFDKIIVRHGDTRDTPMGNGTGGSRGLAMGGAALVQAITKVRDKAQQIAGHMLEAAPEDIVLNAGSYGVRGVPGTGLRLSEIAALAYKKDLPPELDVGLEATAFFREVGLLYPFGTHVAVVEIDQDTGLVEMRNFFSVDDCGPRISPVLVEGQVHGGLAQGISQALWEAVVYDEYGQLLTGSLMDYAVPRAEQLPSFVTGQTETPTPHNPLGVKGIGEAATIGSTPAVVNAVMDALSPFGVRHIDMPLWSEKVWRAIEGGSEQPAISLTSG